MGWVESPTKDLWPFAKEDWLVGVKWILRKDDLTLTEHGKHDSPQYNSLRSPHSRYRLHYHHPRQ